MLDASTNQATERQEFEVGRIIHNEYHLPPTSPKTGTSIDHITVVSHEARRLEWVLDWKLPVVGWVLLHTNRVQWLSVLEGGGTRYECCLMYYGPLATLVKWITWQSIATSLQATADGLKLRSEQRS